MEIRYVAICPQLFWFFLLPGCLWKITIVTTQILVVHMYCSMVTVPYGAQVHLLYYSYQNLFFPTTRSPSWNWVSAVWKKAVPECMVSGQAGLTLLQHLKNVGLAQKCNNLVIVSWKRKKKTPKQRLYLPLKGPGHIIVTVQGHTDCTASEPQRNMRQCMWLMRSSEKHLCEHCFEKKRETWLTQR